MREGSYVFHSDPGHAWLAVLIAELLELGIETMISPYSYENNGKAYLEEDCDATVFMNAYEKKMGHKLEYAESYKERTPIRNYDHYHCPETDHCTEQVEGCWCSSCKMWRTVYRTIERLGWGDGEKPGQSQAWFEMETRTVIKGTPHRRFLMDAVSINGDRVTRKEAA